MPTISCHANDCVELLALCTFPIGKVHNTWTTTEVPRAYAAVEMVSTSAPIECLGGPDSLSAVGSQVGRTDALIRGLLVVLSHHGINDKIGVALDNQVHDYLDSALTEVVWLKRGKYLLSYPFSKYLRNGLPELPDCGPFLPKGCLRAFMKSHLLTYNRKNTHLWFSWLQAKRSCLSASPRQINLTYDKHLETLTKADDGDQQTIDSIMNNQDFVRHLDSIRAGVTSFLLKEKESFTDKQPSLSASYESSRCAGGAYHELNKVANNSYGEKFGWLPPWKKGGPPRYVKHFTDKGHPLPKTFWLHIGSDLVKMEYCNNTVCGNTFLGESVVETRSRGFLELQIDWEEGLCAQRYGLRAKHGVLNAKIQGIIEPMKVRVISKGPASEYYVMKQIQQALHSTMRRMNCYRLIGRPLCPTDVMDIDDYPIAHHLLGNEEWISVDYSAATDNISWKYTKEILKYLIQDLPTLWQQEAMSVLGPHTLTYPNKDGQGYEKSARGTMERGQLMGSILSFPILCVANLGLYLHVTEAYQDGWKTFERLNSVLVNGDDMLYLAPPETFQRHIDEGRKVGLEMTVGKAYHHKSYTNVNSTCVVCPIGGSAYKIDFLNTGLFQGKNRVEKMDNECEEDEDKDARSGVVTVLNDLLKGSLPGRQCELLAAWFNTMERERIEQDTFVNLNTGKFHRNIFLPMCHGGMGVIPPIGWKFTVNLRERKYAMKIVGKLYKHAQGQGVQQFRPFNLSRNVTIPAVCYSAEVDTTKVVLTKNYKCYLPSYFTAQNLRIPRDFLSNSPYPRPWSWKVVFGEVLQELTKGR